MTVATALDLADIQARIAERTQTERADHLADLEAKYRFVRPLPYAANSYVDYVQNPEGRWRLGLPEIDMMTRGFGRGELVMVTGRSHSGKSQIVLNAIANNPDSHILYFSMDEPVELVLAKLVSIKYGIDGEALEDGVKAQNPQVMHTLKRAAEYDFRNLVVIDAVLPIDDCVRAIKEAEDYWGAQTDVAVWDYLELVPGAAGEQSSVMATVQKLKGLIKEADVCGVVIHQNSKSGAPRGKAAGLEGMRFGGTAEAIFVIEVYRRYEDEDLDPWERDRHEHTVTVNLCKNKRPPSKKGERDYYLHPRTGLIRPLQEGDTLMPGDTIKDAASAVNRVTGGQ